MKTECKIDMSISEARAVENVEYWLGQALALGLIITVERRAVMPPAMGRAATVMSVRRQIDRVGEAAVRGGYEK